MTYASDVPQKAKISPEFAARLDQLGPKQKARAIVMLRTKGAGELSGQRQSHVKRQKTIEEIRKSAEPAIADIDDILKHFGGRRLGNSPDALGSIPVESTAAGIAALAASKHVKAILEDQAITLISGSKRP